MLSFERIPQILDDLKNNNAVTVKKLAKKYYASESTIRRDLEKLEKLGIVSRTYGGAMLVDGLYAEIPLMVREKEHTSAKDKIASIAARYIENNQVITLDSSSTVLHIVPYLKAYDSLTIISNGAKTAVECGETLKAKVYSTGGLLRENSLSYVGEASKRFVSLFYTDVLFFSCRALSKEKGLTDISEEEADLRNLMIENTKKVILLLDSSKLDNISFCNLCNLSLIDIVIIDKKPTDEWMSIFKSYGVRVVYE